MSVLLTMTSYHFPLLTCQPYGWLIHYTFVSTVGIPLSVMQPWQKLRINCSYNWGLLIKPITNPNGVSKNPYTLQYVIYENISYKSPVSFIILTHVKLVHYVIIVGFVWIVCENNNEYVWLLKWFPVPLEQPKKYKLFQCLFTHR
jgi:hypothetical protein